ncbi:MAG: DUF3037 domain-containing protein [Caulobacter sp.]|nr:DUF3037 domain-containing protein [Caulobacter sp.]
MYEFAVLRLMPDIARGEAINIGLVVFRDNNLDVRVGPVLTRARLLYPEINDELLRKNVEILRRLGHVEINATERHRVLANVGPLALGELGYFSVADSSPETYESHVSRLLGLFVTPRRNVEQAEGRPNSRLVSSVRKAFRHERVLAAIGDAAALDEHKIVPEWPLPLSSTLKADLALKNGMMRVCEIVDISGASDSALPASLYEGVVTLDAAQKSAHAVERVFAYRVSSGKAKADEALRIAELHATRFVDWDSPVERDGFMHDWIVAAKGVSAPVGSMI